MTVFVFCILPYLSAVLFACGLAVVRVRREIDNRSDEVDVSGHIVAAGGRTILDRTIERLFFESARQRSFIFWLVVLVFHWALFLAVVRHFRYLIYPVPMWVERVQGLGIAAGYALPILILMLLTRRLISKPMIVSSGYMDYLMPGLLLATSLSGLAVRFIWRTDVTAVKQSFLALLAFQPQAPDNPGAAMLFHVIFGSAVLVCLPFFHPVKRPRQPGGDRPVGMERSPLIGKQK